MVPGIISELHVVPQFACSFVVFHLFFHSILLCQFFFFLYKYSLTQQFYCKTILFYVVSLRFGHGDHH